MRVAARGLAARGLAAWGLAAWAAGCSTSTGADWVARTPSGQTESHLDASFVTTSPSSGFPSTMPRPAPPPSYHRSLRSRTIGAGAARATTARTEPDEMRGRLLGIFRNTYYDFPQEREHDGPTVSLFNAACEPLASVPMGFHDAVCVQGSGLLARGQTVSFARRDCECARTCPRTDQQICFDALDPERFPWGRGATGKAIMPLLTVAVDSDVIPLGTPVFIPEYVGVPRDRQRQSMHDGCFIAQDRGMKVRGRHVDVFTGEESLTRFWNELVPSNQGVRVVLDSPYCQRAEVRLQAAPPPRG